MSEPKRELLIMPGEKTIFVLVNGLNVRTIRYIDDAEKNRVIHKYHQMFGSGISIREDGRGEDQ